MPDGLLVIGDYAFESTGFTGTLALPACLRSVGKGSFYGCTGFTALQLPDTVEHIKDYAFCGCGALAGRLTIPDSVSSVGNSAFYGCEGITAVTFGLSLRSVGEAAFRNCSALKSAEFSGEMAPDYYGPEEKKPSFPEECKVNVLPGGASWREIWEKNAPATTPTDDGSLGADKDMPYYWTDGLQNDDFHGGGMYADVMLTFDGARILLAINGRPVGEIPYAADRNEYENRVVSTSGFYCCNGFIRDLHYRDGYNRDSQLFAELVCDGGEVRTVVFHTGSEESLYIGFESED